MTFWLLTKQDSSRCSSELNIMLLFRSTVNPPFIRAPAVRCILKMYLSHVPSVLRNHERGGCYVAVISDLLNLPFHFLGGFSSTLRADCAHATSLPLSPEIIVTPPTLNWLSFLSFHKLRCWNAGTGAGLCENSESVEGTSKRTTHVK